MLKTVKVTGFAYRQDGTPAAGAQGSARLSMPEIDNGIVVPMTYTFCVEEDGYFEFEAWPNERGTAGSYYSVKIYLKSDKVFDAMVVVPDVDHDVEIHDNMIREPYPSISDAERILQEVISNANESKVSAQQAEDSASEAKVSEDNAKTSETLAKQSEDSAKDSEEAARLSETNAKSSEDSSANSASDAETSATSASTSAGDAASSATSAGESASAASTYESNAATSASDAGGYANSAESSATAAANSASDAETSATTATNAATSASESDDNAADSAALAEQSATEAAASAVLAEQHASSIETSVIPLPNRVPKSNDDGLLDDGWMNLAPLRVQVLNALYPDGIYPSLDLRFQGADRINNPNVSFSRDSKATYWDKDGILREADIDEPRFTYDPLTGEALGLLVEGSATNNFPNGLFMASASNDPALVTTVEDEKLPGVQVTKIKGVADDYEGLRHYRTNSEVTSGEASAGPRRVSLLVKPSGSVQYMRVATWNNTHYTNHPYVASVDLWYLQTIRESDHYYDLYLQDVGDGWVFVSFTSSPNVNYTWLSVEFGMDGQGATDYANWTPIPEGDEVLLALPQHYSNTTENIKTFIPTSGTPATRASDIVTIPTSSFGYNTDRGTLVVTSATPVGELVYKLGDVEIYSDSNEAKEYRSTYSTTNNATELELGVGTFKSIQYYDRVLP